MAVMTSEMQLLEEKPWINHITGQVHSASERFEEVQAKMLEEQLLFEKKRSMRSQKNKEKKKKKKMMMMMKKKKNAAEASVTDAGNPEEAELKQRDLLDSQAKLAKTKAKDEEAGKAEASVTEAGKPEESATDAGKAEASDTVEPLMQWRDPITLVSYPQITMKQILEIRMKHRDEQISLEKNTSMRSKKKKKKNKKKAGEASVTEAGKPEESETEAGKAEASVTAEPLLQWHDPITCVYYPQITPKQIMEIMMKHRDEQNSLEKNTSMRSQKNKKKKAAEASVTDARNPEASVTDAIKAVEDTAKTSDASNVLQPVMRVFEDAEYHGAKFESLWNRLFSHYCAYNETTTIPAMRYTHGSDCNVITMDTLQVFSVKVASTKRGIRWPLQVFGMISARDVVDRKRNIIFDRDRDNCQTITKQDPYLTLTGPSRAVVVSTDPSYIEVVLKLKGATGSSKDKELSRVVVRYRLGSCVSGLYPCELSTLELSFGLVANSVEATVHLRVTGGSWPDGFKGVFSAASPGGKGAKVKLLDIGDDRLPVNDADGMIKLSRRVVSVQQGRMLKVFVSACSAAGDEECCEASFLSAEAGVSSGIELKIRSCRMEATVAWSLFCDDY